MLMSIFTRCIDLSVVFVAVIVIGVSFDCADLFHRVNDIPLLAHADLQANPLQQPHCNALF
jgi:hypothetical protein